MSCQFLGELLPSQFCLGCADPWSQSIISNYALSQLSWTAAIIAWHYRAFVVQSRKNVKFASKFIHSLIIVWVWDERKVSGQCCKGAGCVLPWVCLFEVYQLMESMLFVLTFGTVNNGACSTSSLCHSVFIYRHSILGSFLDSDVVNVGQPQGLYSCRITASFMQQYSN